MKLIKAGNGVEYLYSELLPVRHGFSTRTGGVSRLPHTASLDLGFDHGEEPSVPGENLRRFCGAVGVEPERVVTASQIHSAEVRVVGQADGGLGWSRPAWPVLCCDGLISLSAGAVPSVRTADCVPVLLCLCRADGTPAAVAAVHAGWRGTSGRIVSRAVEALLDSVPGAGPSGLRAAVGPHIMPCCYEVGEDLYDAFDPELRARFIAPDPRKPGKYRADLGGANRYLLEQAGVPAENIDQCADCTCCRPDLFYSHRGQHGLRGSMLSMISLQSR